MRSIRLRLFILLSFLFSSVIGINLASYISFLELRNKREQIQIGHEVSVQLRNIPNNLKISEEDLEKLNAHQKLIQPHGRKLALGKVIEFVTEKKSYKFKQHRKTFLANEEEFERFNLNKMAYMEKRVLFFSGLSGIVFLVGFIFVHSFLKHLVIKPIQELSSRMMDFLHNRFTYRFEAPKNNEIGDLHATFNSLAQRVINHTEELTSLDQAKSEFLSIASHELRTPLTSIKGSLSLLKGGMGGELNDVTAELLGIAETESDRLIRLINDLLDLAKIEAGKLPLETNWVSVSELAQVTFNSLNGLAQSAQVNLTLANESPHLQTLIDKDRIQQVLTNLMSNAIKFSPQGESVILKVHVNKENKLCFEVKDHGKGIDPQDQQLIFQKFRQATGPNNPLVKGTGLGLAIARALVEEHGGEIGLKSKPGEGSTFYFTLSQWRLHEAKQTAEAS